MDDTDSRPAQSFHAETGIGKKDSGQVYSTVAWATDPKKPWGRLLDRKERVKPEILPVIVSLCLTGASMIYHSIKCCEKSWFKLIDMLSM